MSGTRFRILSIAVVCTLVALAIGCGGGSAPKQTDPATGSPEPAREERPADAEPAGPPAPEGSATITGRVTYEGEVPSMRPLKMDADPGCAKKHSEPVASEQLVLGPDQSLANVFVTVKHGLPEGSHAPHSEAAVLDQNGCRYVPHVLGVMAGQTLKILNSDGLLHNVHALPKENQTFNSAMPASRTETEVTFTKPELFKIKCDVHPWMGAWIAVVDHPYYDVTGTDGRFSLTGLPAGGYEIEVWHEKLGTLAQQTIVAGDDTVELNFTMSR